MGGDHLQEFHETCQESIRGINALNLTFFPPSVLLPAPQSGWSQMKVRRHRGPLRWSTDLSLPRHRAGWRRVESRSGGTNKETKFHIIIINNNLLVWNREPKCLSGSFLFYFAFDNWMRENDCMGPRKPLAAHYVQSRAPPREETGTNTKCLASIWPHHFYGPLSQFVHILHSLCGWGQGLGSQATEKPAEW